jgi:hypothetical protein
MMAEFKRVRKFTAGPHAGFNNDAESSNRARRGKIAEGVWNEGVETGKVTG